MTVKISYDENMLVFSFFIEENSALEDPSGRSSDKNFKIQNWNEKSFLN